MVVHFRNETGIVHQSFVGVSDVTKHSAPTTCAFLMKLIPEILKMKPGLQLVHYISDSPANQYRNKFMLKFISDHCSLFPGIKATWEYLEAGHGKGPCDGVGGSVKKSLETYVKRGNVVRNANDVMLWADNVESVVKILLVTAQEIKSCEAKLRKAMYVKGLNSIHSVRPGNSHLMIRETSCYEPCCRHTVTVNNHGWQETVVKIGVLSNVTENADNEDISVQCEVGPGPSDDDGDVHVLNNDSDVNKTTAEPQDVESGDVIETPDIEPHETAADVPKHDDHVSSNVVVQQNYSVGEYVDVRYGRKTYVGQVTEYSEELHEYNINFMQKRKNGYIWPKRKDELWVIPDDIICVHKFV